MEQNALKILRILEVSCTVFQIDFDRPLDQQGPFSVILHKLTDQMARVQDGSMTHIDMFQVDLVIRSIYKSHDLAIYE